MANILLVENDSETRNLLIPVAEKMGHEVTAVNSVADAWEWEVLEHDFDLYVLGVAPGDLSAFGLCSTLHIVYPGRPLLVLLSAEMSGGVQQALDAGATAYLRKPMRTENFESALSHMLYEEREVLLNELTE